MFTQFFQCFPTFSVFSIVSLFYPMFLKLPIATDALETLDVFNDFFNVPENEGGYFLLG